jgi:hypothetical protein
VRAGREGFLPALGFLAVRGGRCGTTGGGGPSAGAEGGESSARPGARCSCEFARAGGRRGTESAAGGGTSAFEVIDARASMGNASVASRIMSATGRRVLISIATRPACSLVAPSSLCRRASSSRKSSACLGLCASFAKARRNRSRCSILTAAMISRTLRCSARDAYRLSRRWIRRIPGLPPGLPLRPLGSRTGRFAHGLLSECSCWTAR